MTENYIPQSQQKPNPFEMSDAVGNESFLSEDVVERAKIVEAGLLARRLLNPDDFSGESLSDEDRMHIEQLRQSLTSGHLFIIIY